MITFVTAALKFVFSVPKTGVGLSRRKLYALNVDHIFLISFIHKSPAAYKKGARPKPRTGKAQAPIAAKQTFDK